MIPIWEDCCTYIFTGDMYCIVNISVYNGSVTPTRDYDGAPTAT